MPGAHSPYRSNSANANRLTELAAAIEAYRHVSPRRHFPPGIRAQVVAALDAGVSMTAIVKACRLSWEQVTRWKSGAKDSRPAPTRVAPTPPKILSVVDPDARQAGPDEADIEIRIGQWRLMLTRVAD